MKAMEAKSVCLALTLCLSTLVAQAEEWSTNHPCFRGGSNDGWDRYVMTNAESLGGALVSLSSGTNQVLDWTAIPALTTLTIFAEDPKGTITNGVTISVSVPAAWRCRFDTGAAVTYGGNASSRVSPASYSGDGRTLLIPVAQDFEAGDTLTVAGLKLADLRLVPAGADRLELDFDGDGARDVYDQYAILVSVPRPGGAYDGWDVTMSDYSTLVRRSGTIIRIH